MLYQNGAKPDVSEFEKNPLFAAIYEGHYDVVVFLVENGIDITEEYPLGQSGNMDAYGYARMYGETEIAEYLKGKLKKPEAENKKPAKERDFLGRLKELYQNKKIESKLDKQYFIDLYKAAVMEVFPKIKEKYASQSIYGISFEIANVVQRVFAEDYYTTIYLNTEERYQEAIKECDEDEKIFYRFSAWAEWLVERADSPLFDKVQDYLLENSMGLCTDISPIMPEELEDDIREWYETVEAEIDKVHEQERENIRFWLAQALGELRCEGFWEHQGHADIYVLPFEGECEISKEELISTYKEIDRGCHGTEYFEYLEEN